MTRVLVTTILAISLTAPATACFGPKLYLGVAAEPRQEMLFALVSLYVVEKTGVQSEQVILNAADQPETMLAAEQVDLVFAPAPLASTETVLAIPGYPVLVCGARPLHDLQFTTVAPALRKLATLLTPGDLLDLEARIAAGEKPLAAARRLCQERRWL
jgi:hypothetical protein